MTRNIFLDINLLIMLLVLMYFRRMSWSNTDFLNLRIILSLPIRIICWYRSLRVLYLNRILLVIIIIRKKSILLWKSLLYFFIAVSKLEYIILLISERENKIKTKDKELFILYSWDCSCFLLNVDQSYI